MIKNLKQWKSSLIGIVLIGLDIAYLILKDDINITVFIVNLLLGIGLLFIPDNILNGLKSFIRNNRNKQI